MDPKNHDDSDTHRSFGHCGNLGHSGRRRVHWQAWANAPLASEQRLTGISALLPPGRRFGTGTLGPLRIGSQPRTAFTKLRANGQTRATATNRANSTTKNAAPRSAALSLHRANGDILATPPTPYPTGQRRRLHRVGADDTTDWSAQHRRRQWCGRSDLSRLSGNEPVRVLVR